MTAINSSTSCANINHRARIKILLILGPLFQKVNAAERNDEASVLLTSIGLEKISQHWYASDLWCFHLTIISTTYFPPPIPAVSRRLEVHATDEKQLCFSHRRKGVKAGSRNARMSFYSCPLLHLLPSLHCSHPPPQLFVSTSFGHGNIHQ